MRVSILCDFMDTVGGGERVALFLAQRLGAPLVTARLDPHTPDRAGFPDVRVHSLGGVPGDPPLRQILASAKFARARFPDVEGIVCIGNYSLYAAPNHPRHLWYCLTPTRMFFDLRRAILGRVPRALRPLVAVWFGLHGRWEKRAVRRTKRILAPSETARARIRRYYGRDVPVLHPPVPTSRYHFQELGDFWLSVNRLHPEKRIGLQVEVFRRLPDERLKIVGGGNMLYVRSLRPPPNVEFLGEIRQDHLVDLYATCRGVLATAIDEDFGLTPVEAMAAGKCTLATNEGGYRETILPGETGFLLPPDSLSFASAIHRLDDSTLQAMRDPCRARATKFDERVFLEGIRRVIGV